MRIFVLIILIATLLASAAGGGAAAPQRRWTKVYDVPAPNFGAVEMFDDARGVATGAGGLFYTTDGGQTWQEGSTDQPVALGGAFSNTAYISFADADTAWVAGFTGQMWHTADGGRSWTKQATNTVAHFNSVSAISKDEAWAAAFGVGFSDVGPFDVPASVLLWTTDGGATWTQALRSSTYGVFHQVEFVDAQHGWLIATPCFPGQPTQACEPLRQTFAGSALLRTDDGGRTWQPVPLPAETSRPNRMQWFAGGRGLLQTDDCTIVCSEHLYRSDDGGATWTPLAVPENRTIGALRFVTADRGYVSTTQCTTTCSISLWETLDAANTWRLVSAEDGPGFGSNFDATSTAVIAPTPLDGTPSGITRIDLASGSRTAAVVPGHAAFNDIAFASRERGYAVNRDGLWVSDDGGAHWQAGPVPLSAGQVSAPSRDVVWIMGTDPGCEHLCAAVSRSVDGGRTWSTSDRRFGPSQGFDALDAQTAWLSADEGLWRTRDGGNTWQLLGNESGPWEFIDGSFGFSPTCQYGCDQQFVVTTDGGVTTERRALPDLTRPDFFLTPLVGWATGEVRDEQGGCQFCWGVFKTTDGGRTWTETWRSASQFTTGVEFIDTLRGWGVQGVAGPDGGRGGIAFTSDGGSTWTTELPGAAGKLITRNGRVWAALGAQPVFGGGSGAARTTIWRSEYGDGVTLPDTGTSAGTGSGATTAALLLATAGALLFAGALRARRSVR